MSIIGCKTKMNDRFRWLIFLLFQYFSIYLCYEIVYYQSTSKIYLLKYHTLREISDKATLSVLNCQVPIVQNIYTDSFSNSSNMDTCGPNRVINTSEYSNYTLGEKIIIAAYNGTRNDLLRIDRVKNKLLQGSLHHKLDYIGVYMNPSVVKWNNRYIMANSMTWGKYEGKKPALGRLMFKWLNSSCCNIFYSNETYLGIPSNNIVSPLPYRKPRGKADITEFKLEDPRFLVMNSSWIHIVFTVTKLKQISPGSINLYLNPSTNRVELVDFKIYQYDHEYRCHQKNWSPFVHDNQILYIQSLNPMIVVKPTKVNTIGYKKAKFTLASTYSHVSYNSNITWAYGTLRGGTNCVRVENEYVGIFHSIRTSNITLSKTYVMGAYTFSTKPPFRLLRISPLPLLFEAPFYIGRLHSKWTQWRIDYITFPMSLSIENNEFLLSLGYQDKHGWLARFNISTLLNSLVSIEWGGDINIPNLDDEIVY